ncbi:hypothetical protein [Solibacillus sp. NPDC093137]|uniref:hypothetical protein n=1 Tax=Solibacillus sp. NPDC093137 TaxID=3390678 RepID=UPI003D008CE5
MSAKNLPHLFDRLDAAFDEVAVTEEQHGIKEDRQINVYKAMYFETDITDIDFDSFSLLDIYKASESFYEHACYLDDDGVILENEHFLSRIRHYDDLLSEIHLIPTITIQSKKFI